MFEKEVKNSVIIEFKPTCECGWVFEELDVELIDSKMKGGFFSPTKYQFKPWKCPCCNRVIEGISYQKKFINLINKLD